MKINEIEQRIRDRYRVDDLGSPVVGRYIADAVQYYSRFNPVLSSTTVVTVASQQDYDLPNDCLLVKSADYWPSGELYAELRAGAESTFILQPSGTKRYHNYSLRVIDDVERSEYVNRMVGHWESLNGQLRLWPTPSASGTDITVEYFSAHAATDGDYTTIPDEDMGIVVALALAEILDAVAIEESAMPDYSEGLQRLTRRFVPGNVALTVERLRNRVREKYGGPVVSV